jgi:hypothetical protein
MRQWTAEERQRQAQLIHKWKPWERSTGARTPEGKAKVSQNAYKGSVRGLLKSVAKLLKSLR